MEPVSPEQAQTARQGLNELRDFYTQLRIVAPAHRKAHFEDRIRMDTLHEIRSRVKFVSIDNLEEKYTRSRW